MRAGDMLARMEADGDRLAAAVRAYRDVQGSLTSTAAASRELSEALDNWDKRLWRATDG